MAETVYNLTIPHTSPSIRYDGFDVECPDTTDRGFPLCDNTGFHVASNSSGEIRFDFDGIALYVYGRADPGMQYTWSVDFGTENTGEPNGDVLIAAENLQKNRFSDTMSLTIDLSQFEAGARFEFTHAVVVVGTGKTGATTVIDRYAADNSTVQKTTGWTTNSTMGDLTYIQSGEDETQTAVLNFEGVGIWVYGFCGPRGQFFGGEYGTVKLDDRFDDWLYSTGDIELRDRVVHPKCLLWWATGLEDGPHTLNYDSGVYNVLIESFEVLRVEGGEFVSGDRTSRSFSFGLPTGTSFGPSPTDSDDVRRSTSSKSNKTGAIAGGIVGGLALIAIVAVFLFFKKRRQQKANDTNDANIPQYHPPPPQMVEPQYSGAAYYATTPASQQPLVPVGYTPPVPGYYGGAEVENPPSAYPGHGYSNNVANYSPTTTTSGLPPTTTSDRSQTTNTEVARLRQEMDALMNTMYAQQRGQVLSPDPFFPPPDYAPGSPPPHSEHHTSMHHSPLDVKERGPLPPPPTG